MKGLVLSLLFTGFGFSAIQGVSWIPHIPVNDQFKTSIQFRNDDDAAEINIFFFHEDGSDAHVTYVDGDFEATKHQISFELDSLNTRVMQIRSITSGERSVQAIVFAIYKGNVIGSNSVSAEAVYTKYSPTGEKQGMVGSISSQTYDAFAVNIDKVRDIFTGTEKTRGFAIVNGEFDGDCNCSIALYDHTSDQVAIESFTIKQSAKALFLVEDIFPSASSLLSEGHGFLLAVCNREIVALGLEFDGDAFGSATIKSFQLDKRKYLNSMMSELEALIGL